MFRQLKENCFYVINQPKKSTVSIIIVDKVDKKSEVLRKSLDTLCEATDVIFIFSSIFPETKFINPKKFTTLYNGCTWVYSEDLYSTLIRTLRYTLNIFDNHIGFCFLRTSDLIEESLNKKFKDNVLKLNGSSIISPIFELRRLNSEELGEIYSNVEINERNFLGSLFKKRNLLEEDIDNIYTTHISTTRIMYLKRITVYNIINYLDGLDYDYIGTFKYYDFHYFLASLLVKMGTTIIDNNIETVEFGRV